VPDDPIDAVPQLLAGDTAGWTVAELERLRELLWNEYAGPDRADALAAVNRLLALRR
jgi:hypothetical protein